MNYEDQITVCGAEGELAPELARKKYGLIVTFNDLKDLYKDPEDLALGTVNQNTDVHFSDMYLGVTPELSVDIFQMDEAQFSEYTSGKVQQSVFVMAEHIRLGHDILVYCVRGLHRSPCLALACLLSLELNAEDALRAMYKIRPKADYSDERMHAVRIFQETSLGQKTIWPAYKRQRNVILMKDRMSRLVRQENMTDYEQVAEMVRAYDPNAEIPPLTKRYLLDMGFKAADKLQRAEADAVTLCGSSLPQLVMGR